MGIQSFFQIAATLIPVLLFGNVLVNRQAPKDSEVLRRPYCYVAIPLLAMFAIAGEMLAIRGAIIGEATSIERAFVIGTVLLGMVTVALVASLPALDALGRASKGTFGRMRPQAVIAVSIVGLGI